MITFRKSLLTGSLIAVIAFSAAGCSSNTPEGPFVTPTVAPSNAAESVSQETDKIEQYIDKEAEVIKGPDLSVDDVTPAELLPFAYDSSKFEPEADAVEVWGAEMAKKALPRALETLETTAILDTVWTNEERTVRDFEPIRDYMTPGAFAIIEHGVNNNVYDRITGLMLFNTPRVTAVDADGVSFKPDPTPPVVTMVENPRMTVVEDPEFLGSMEKHYVLGATINYEISGTNDAGERKVVTYTRDVALYMVPTGDQWYLAGWTGSAMELVK